MELSAFICGSFLSLRPFVISFASIRGSYCPEPPAKSDEEETPVFKELRWFAFGSVAEELADPAQGKQG